jgi:transglutaminase-like putative cysteine protease
MIMYKSTSKPPLFFFIILVGLFLSGCGRKESQADSSEPPVYSPLQVLEPEAPGDEVVGNDPLLLDISCITQGYLTAFCTSTDTRSNLQITDPGGILYSYFIEPGNSAVIPFSGGDGQYLLTCYQQIDDSQYAALYSQILEVTLDNEFLPYLYPNQYVNFSAESEASKLALSMLAEDAQDLEAVEAIYNYVTENITYDEDKAVNVESGYLPDVDETLETRKGICFDYAALTTAMLRSRDIPCKLQIGYSGQLKHAWIDVYIRSKGWINNAISFDEDTWTRLDPTFDSNADDKETIQSYIGDGSNYTVQFTR